MAAFAFADGLELGIDIEKIRSLPQMDSIAERSFSVAEAADLRSLGASERETAFFHAWTRKEAYLKATGAGLFGPLDAVAVEAWQMHALQPAPGYVGALAYRGSRRELVHYPAMAPCELLTGAAGYIIVSEKTRDEVSR